jgi:aromatic ring-cleaving dioxygenase
MQKIEGYHVHIYAKEGEDFSARLVAAKLAEFLSGDARGPFEIGAIGPHPLPNYEVNLPRERFGEALQWLHTNGAGLSILVHPETDNVVQDHTVGAIWLGEQLALDQPFLARFAQKERNRPKQP